MFTKRRNIFHLILFFLIISITGCTTTKVYNKPIIPEHLFQIPKKPTYPKTNEVVGIDTANYIIEVENINNICRLKMKTLYDILYADKNSTK